MSCCSEKAWSTSSSSSFFEARDSLRLFTQVRDRGLALAEGRFAQALTELQAAFALKPDPELRIGEGQALGGAALVAGIIAAVYVSQHPSATLYTVAWQ